MSLSTGYIPFQNWEDNSYIAIQLVYISYYIDKCFCCNCDERHATVNESFEGLEL